MRTARNPSVPMEEALSAMYTSMPWITHITAISVVVERIIPSSVRKLRSLLDRRESNATLAASRKDAWLCTVLLGYEFARPFVHPAPIKQMPLRSQDLADIKEPKLSPS